MYRLKKKISCLLIVLLVLSSLPMNVTRAEENTKFPYTIYASAQTIGAISINSNNICVNGNMATDGTIITTIDGNFNGEKIENADIGMVDVSEKLNSKYFFNDKDRYIGNVLIENTNINMNNVSITKGNLEFCGNVNLNTQIRTSEDITISGQTLNANNCVIYSEYGDVNINSENISVTGFIYAPFGDVIINANNVNLNSVIIIAKTVNIDCKNLNVNYNENMARTVGMRSKDIINDREYVLAFGNYNSIGKSIDIEWFTNCENGVIEVLESDSGIEYSVIKTAENNNSFSYKIDKEFKEKYFRVTCLTEEGCMIESIPFKVVMSNNEYVVELIDTDGEGVPDIFELLYGTDGDKRDTDNDGLTDNHEIYITKTNPVVYDSIKETIVDAKIDLDNDNICNSDEILLGIDPLNLDTDEDGLNDSQEISEYYTKASVKDTDIDGLEDGDEIALGLNPCNPDTDGDGTLDGNEYFETFITKDDMMYILLQ